jgi:glucose/arabinose dehydrogenase
VAAPPGDARLFIVEKTGTVRILREAGLVGQPFLDISALVSGGNEQGLLSIAFHPDFEQTGRFFVYYTDASGDTRVVGYTTSGDPDRADPASARAILEVDQPRGNHNGGHILFGPDRLLYIGLGDGGGAGDPYDTGQDRSSLLGTILRVDVDGGSPYSIPADNPYAGHATFRPEIWAWGLRNPWRLDIDATDGLLYVADVGQNRVEEVNVAPLSAGGLNYGWNIAEGSECFGAGSCDTTGLQPPAVEYRHDEGCSVTGGVVYRGDAIPGLRGHYLYSDYCSDWIRSFRWVSGSVSDATQWGATAARVTSYGRDGFGEVYLATDGGSVHRIEAAP